jgi:hypothetical protein
VTQLIKAITMGRGNTKIPCQDSLILALANRAGRALISVFILRFV